MRRHLSPTVRLTAESGTSIWLGEGNRLPQKGRWQGVAADLGATGETLCRELSRRRTEGRGA